jgi:hypothetical protein
VRALAELLDERTRQVSATSDQSAQRIERVASLLRQGMDQSSERASQIVASVEQGSQNLYERLQALSAAFAHSEGAFDQLSDTLEERGRVLGDVSDRAVERVTQWDRVLRSRTEALARASTDIQGHARGVSRAMEEQTRNLRSASQHAAAILADLKGSLDHAEQDEFFRNAAFVLERLQSLGVDMTRVLETVVSDDDWRRFTSGDKGVFVRKLLGFREKTKLAHIRERFQQDGEFRQYAQRYMTDFEGMLRESRKRDRDGIVSTTLLSSEIGKVYMLLSRAVGRET